MGRLERRAHRCTVEEGPPRARAATHQEALGRVLNDIACARVDSRSSSASLSPAPQNNTAVSAASGSGAPPSSRRMAASRSRSREQADVPRRSRGLPKSQLPRPKYACQLPRPKYGHSPSPASSIAKPSYSEMQARVSALVDFNVRQEKCRTPEELQAAEPVVLSEDAATDSQLNQARRSLWEAVAGGCISALGATLETAQELHLQDAGLFSKADARLVELMEAKEGLQLACEMEVDIVPGIQEALRAATKARLEDEIVSEARAKACKLQECEAALSTAAQSGSIALMLAALSSADELGLVTEVGCDVYAKMKKLQKCRQGLQNVTGSGDVPELQRALQQARDAGLADEAVSAVECELRQLDKVEQCKQLRERQRVLVSAVQTGSTLSLQAELDIALVEGLPEDAVEAAANMAHIESPVDDAVEAEHEGLPDDEVAPAEPRQDHLRALVEEVSSAHRLSKREGYCGDLSRLSKALLATDGADLQDDVISEARKSCEQRCMAILFDVERFNAAEVQMAIEVAARLGICGAQARVAKDLMEEVEFVPITHEVKLQKMADQLDDSRSSDVRDSSKDKVRRRDGSPDSSESENATSAAKISVLVVPKAKPKPKRAVAILEVRTCPSDAPWASVPKTEWKRLRSAAMNNDVTAAQTSLDIIAGVVGCSAFSRDGHGEGALHYAAASYSVDVVRFFLERGADPQALTSEDRTPLQELDKWVKHAERKGTPPGEWKARAEATKALLEGAIGGGTVPIASAASSATGSAKGSAAASATDSARAIETCLRDTEPVPSGAELVYGGSNCAECNVLRPRDSFSKNQWRLRSDLRRCKTCVGAPPDTETVATTSSEHKAEASSSKKSADDANSSDSDKGEASARKGQKRPNFAGFLQRKTQRRELTKDRQEREPEAEPSSDGHSPRQPDEDGHAHGMQLAILRNQLQSCKDIWKLDPSINPKAETMWKGRMQEVDVMELRNTHSDVAGAFKNGKHKGKPILALLEELQAGKTRPSDLPWLVAARQFGKLWVIFGNRRLSMLKRYAQSAGRPVRMRVIIHTMPYPDLGTEKLNQGFVAKFVLATTTDDGGASAPIRGSKSRQAPQQPRRSPVPRKDFKDKTFGAASSSRGPAPQQQVKPSSTVRLTPAQSWQIPAGKGIPGTGTSYGTVKSFNGEKGYGFISHEGTDVFFHQRDMVDGSTPQPGDSLQFDLEENPQKAGSMKATNATGGHPGAPGMNFPSVWAAHQWDSNAW